MKTETITLEDGSHMETLTSEDGSKMVYVFDRDGNQTRLTYYDSDGSISHDTYYRLDPSGEFDVWESNDSNGVLSRKYEVVYDSQGREIEVREYDGDGHLDGRMVSLYDSEGNSEQCYFNANNALIKKEVREYREKICKVLTLVYSNEGDLIHQETRLVSRDITSHSTGLD